MECWHVLVTTVTKIHLSSLFYFTAVGSKDATVSLVEGSCLWFSNGSREILRINHRVLVSGRPSPHLNSVSCCIADKKKSLLCQEPLTQNRDQLQCLTEALSGNISQQGVIFSVDATRTCLHINKQILIPLPIEASIREH